MAEGDCASEDIDALGIDLKELNVGKGDCREGLVELVVVNILDTHISALEETSDSPGGGNAKINGCDFSIFIVKDASEGRKATLLGDFLSHNDEGACTIVKLGGVSSSDSAVLGECWLKTGHLVWEELLALLILVDTLLLALVVLHDINDFPIEEALGLSLSCALIRFDGVLILRFTCDAKLAAGLFCARSHEHVVVNVSETVKLNRIDCLNMAIAGRLSEEEVVRSL
jgi:hypothetical protein